MAVIGEQAFQVFLVERVIDIRAEIEKKLALGKLQFL